MRLDAMGFRQPDGHGGGMVRRPASGALLSLVLASFLAACGSVSSAGSDPATVIYVAESIVPMTGEGTEAAAIAVRDGRILELGSVAEMKRSFPGATVDQTFKNNVIYPGFIDPHTHITFGAALFAHPLTPPWPMATAAGMTEALGTRQAFLAELARVAREAQPGEPVVVYGYHHLVHGRLTRTDLDAIAGDRPLIVWHYSGHDFFLNSFAIAQAGLTPALAETYHGVELDADGALTGRIYEDAGFLILQKFPAALVAPEVLARGYERYASVLLNAGVTTTAELGYGLLGFPLEDRTLAENWGSVDEAGYRLYLVPEHRALQRQYKEKAPQAALDLASGKIAAPAPALPRVKFFTDAAYYSQTMRVTAPGYLSGPLRGTEGLWVTQPEAIAPMVRPYMQAGLAVQIHSNGDAAQTATLSALETLRNEGFDEDFTFEHGGLFSPDQISRATALGAQMSAASHYVFYLGNLYQPALGSPRQGWITPLGAMSRAGLPVALHSDAPLAPTQPLRAASVHVTRMTREGTVLDPALALTPYEALDAITLDAARVLGLEGEIGSLVPGKLADFTVLDADPLKLPAADWPEIGVWGVVLGGEKRPIVKP
jgi:predicted amidohydrolase YtcJ